MSERARNGGRVVSQRVEIGEFGDLPFEIIPVLSFLSVGLRAFRAAIL